MLPGTPACALGWIATIAALESDEACWDMDSFREFMKDPFFNEKKFYHRMNELAPEKAGKSLKYAEDWDQGKYVWAQDPQVCADTLRKYAQKYHAPELAPAVTDEGRRSVGNLSPVESEAASV